MHNKATWQTQLFKPSLVHHSFPLIFTKRHEQNITNPHNCFQVYLAYGYKYNYNLVNNSCKIYWIGKSNSKSFQVPGPLFYSFSTCSVRQHDQPPLKPEQHDHSGSMQRYTAKSKIFSK